MYVLTFTDLINTFSSDSSVSNDSEIVLSSRSVAKLKKWVAKNDKESGGYVKTRWQRIEDTSNWFGATVELGEKGNEVGEGSDEQYYLITKVRELK